MSRAAAALAALVALAATGCTVGPDHAAPDLSADLGATWGAETPADGAEDLAAWWRLLDDEELARLVEAALADNLDLVEARERIVAARARRGIENAGRLPTLDATASYERVATGDDGLALGGAPGGSETDIYSAGVVAGWELDLWGRVARLVEAADAEIDFAVEDLRAARVALAAEVAREIIAIRAIDAELAIVRANVESDRDALAIAESRARAGFADALDASRARRVLEANEAILPRLEGDRREAELRLAVLLGRRPGTVTVGVRPLPRRDVLPALGVPAELLARRPDVRRAERDLAAATARIGAAEAARLPRVTLAGAVALQGPELSDVTNPDAHVLRGGPAIVWPVLAGGRLRSEVDEAGSLQRQALARLRRTVLDAVAEVEAAATQRARIEQRVARLDAAEASARETEALSLDRYEAGAVDFLDVTEARAQRLLIERERLVAEREALGRLVDLYAALGGGWSPDDGLARSDAR